MPNDATSQKLPVSPGRPDPEHKEMNADPWTQRPGRLRDGVFPSALAASARHDEIAVAPDRGRRVGPPPWGPEQECPGSADRDDRLPSCPPSKRWLMQVAQSRDDAVAAVAVEAEPPMRNGSALSIRRGSRRRAPVSPRRARRIRRQVALVVEGEAGDAGPSTTLLYIFRHSARHGTVSRRQANRASAPAIQQGRTSIEAPSDRRVRCTWPSSGPGPSWSAVASRATAGTVQSLTSQAIKHLFDHEVAPRSRPRDDVRRGR